MDDYSSLILYKQVWHCKWIHYYCTLECSVNLLCELEIKDLLLHAVYALLPVSFPRVFSVKTKYIRQQFCQVFLFYISALVAVAEELLVPSYVCCLFISNTIFRQQCRYGTAFSHLPCPLPPALIPFAAVKMRFTGIVFLLLNCIFCKVLGVCVCVCFLYYIMQDTATLEKARALQTPQNPYFHVTWLGEFVHCFIAADWVTELRSLLQL